MIFIKEPLSIVYSFIKVWIYMNKTLSGRLQERKNIEKVQLGNPKSGHSCLRDSFFTKFNSQFKRGFAKVVVNYTVELVTYEIAHNQ